MTAEEATPLDPQISRPRRTRLQGVFREVLKAPITAKFGILVILSYGFVAIFAPVLTPYGEREIVGPEFDVWGEQFILGTDGLGRDMLTRLLFGARNTVGIAFITTILAFVIGGLTGLFAAIYSGWFDQLASRVVDVLMAIPQLIFALMLLTIFGTSIPTLIIVIATLDATRIFRVTRAVSLNVVVLDYFEAARLRGERMFWLCIREILPNIMAPLMAEFGLRFCFVFLMIAALSFLGLGVQPPTADWGSMVRENAVLITYGDITPILPAIAIAVLTLGVNFLVDWFLHKSSGLKDGH
ncbi:MAG: ABC transporter permease [Proteobacteria bacterium]|nr:ABC transporter permease [Pseudomonadota bacterium]MBT5819132.1 ABC transporter permease [Pseudomonadota bacterium]MBT6350359.1 ABC transporter permease [Pseudomonadota bacterium]